MKFTKTWQVALGGVLAAGSLAVLWLGMDGEVAAQTDNWPGKAV